MSFSGFQCRGVQVGRTCGAGAGNIFQVPAGVGVGVWVRGVF